MRVEHRGRIHTLPSRAKSFSKSNLGVHSKLMGSPLLDRPLLRSKEHVYLRVILGFRV